MTERYVVGVDTGLSGTLRAADHLLLDLAAELGLDDGVVGCTHHVREGRRHTALSFSTPSERVARAAWRALAERECGAALGAERHGPDELAAGAAHAAAEHLARTGGRAVRYAGADALTGTVTVARLLSVSAIERIVVLGTPDGPDPDQRIVTRDHVRPEWREGRLTLAAMPAAGGTLVPFEVPDPTPCCADH
ncbi:hypothetical protein ACFWD7_40240 [Streptomyces mirabilis]|uniref:hypothetical protein n=1 Tax=Streptomyces mirabilis TaxID=68239 RepID=UPI0021C17A5A|nr:hypothetical protein [Streptomyces mirabilis]MCT9110428.1 hypothetical protein [Streptomyces mirabilis]